MRKYAPWVAAVLVMGVAFYFVVFGRAMPHVPEMTPEEKAELEEIQREMDMLREEIEAIDRLKRLHLEGKLWSA